MTAPRRLQLRRGNTAATSTYVGAPGELVVNTTTNTLYLHDGSTVGGYATTINVATITNQLTSAEANIVIANVGMRGYVDSVASRSIYGNANVKSYLTGGFDGNIIPSANVTYNLGDNTHRWKDLYLSGTTIFLGSTTLSADATTGAIRSPVTRTLYNQSFLPGTANSANTYTLAYSQTPGSTVTVLVVGQQVSGPAPSYYLTEGSDFTISGLTLIVTASYTATSITCYETYVDTGDLLTASEISTETLTPPSGDLTVDGSLIVTGDLTVSPTSIYMGTLRISAADGNLTVNTGIKFSDGSVQSSSYSNVQVATYLSTYTGNIGNVKTTSNVITTGYFIGNGALLTGVASSYSNINVTAFANLSNYAWNANITSGSSNYSNVNTAAYLGANYYITSNTANLSTYAWASNVTTANAGIKGYVDLANTIQSAQISAANVGIIGYIDLANTIQSAQVGAANLAITAANVGIIGYIDQGNSIQATAITTANTAMKGYVDSLTYSNVQTAAYLITNNYLTSATANLSLYAWNANITGGGSNYSNANVASYLPTYSGVVTASNVAVNGNVTATYFVGNGALLTGIVGGGGNYSNVDVANYLPTYAGTVSASLVNSSGNILSTGLSVFGNTRIGLAGAVSGQFHTIVGNITQTSSGGAVYINTTGNVLAAAVVAGAVTTTGTMAVNSATGITTNQGTFLLANATATTINMGGAATTINLGTTASATGNVFVGGQIGSNAYNLTLRANGRYNTATSINSNGGFNSPPYANQAVIGGTGTGMTANYSATGGYIDSLTIYNSGTGYRNGDVISVPGGIAGNSFVLQNYSANRVGAFTGTALYTFGIDGNLIVPGNVYANSATITGNVTVGGNLTITGTKNNVPVKSGGFVAQNTAVSMDSITAQWLNTGGASANQLSLAALTGNVTMLYTYTFQDGTGGSTTGGSASTTLANLSFGWTSIGNPSGVAGDMYNVLVSLPGTNAYRITAMTGSGYSNNVLTIERLV